MNRKGFTLIELLIVVVIIGILAAIAIPKFANTKEKAYIASMKSDLRNLVTAEEAYFADSANYTANWSCASPTPAGNVAFCTSSGVGVAPGAALAITITPDGWNALVGHNATTRKCDIYVGSTPAGGGAANKEGEPKCQ
ncbi:MAG: type IV pilin protein [Gemmatimonadales bacterium]